MFAHRGADCNRGGDPEAAADNRGNARIRRYSMRAPRAWSGVRGSGVLGEWSAPFRVNPRPTGATSAPC